MIKRYLICPGTFAGKSVSAEDLIQKHGLDIDECVVAQTQDDVKNNKTLRVVCPGIESVASLEKSSILRNLKELFSKGV